MLDGTWKITLGFRAHPITELSALGSFAYWLCPRVSAVPQLLLSYRRVPWDVKAGLGVLKVFMAGDKIWAGNKSMVLFYCVDSERRAFV